MKYNKDYYEILEISPKASEEVIKMAYKALVKKYHPDVTKVIVDDEKIRDINEAYEILSDSQKRMEYDYLRNIKTSEVKVNQVYEEKESEWSDDIEMEEDIETSNKQKKWNPFIILVFIIALVSVIALLDLFMKELNSEGSNRLRRTVIEPIAKEVKVDINEFVKL